MAPVQLSSKSEDSNIHREAVFEPRAFFSSFIGPRVVSPRGSNTAVPTGPQVRMATLDSREELLRSIGNVSTEELRLAEILPSSSHLKTFCGEATEELPI